MQLKDRKGIGASIAAATCALLGTTPAKPVRADEVSPWSLDTALLYYGEQDGRVRDLSGNVLVRREFRDEHFLDLKLVIDSLTGASPNGALPSDMPQTFTRPSGNDTYVAAPGEFPLDDTFLDTRYALDAGWSQPLGRLNRFNAGVSFSTEYDYTHTGINANLSRDFFERNTTLSIGAAYGMDDLSPEGGAPMPLAPMRSVGDQSSKLADESKDVVDLLFGVTQVIDRRTIVQLNYSLSQSDGYLNDPYRLITVLDPGTGELVPGPDPGVNLYLYESRPDERTKHSFFGKVKHDFDRDVLSLSYRFMTDDWGIDSHTVDAQYRWQFSPRNYLEPHVRYYRQAEADFYRTSLAAGAPLPEFASSDYRLGKFNAITVGAKFGHNTSRGQELGFRLEYYTTSGAGSMSELYPDLDAIIVQFSYGFGR